jgi:hypothetical protein
MPGVILIQPAQGLCNRLGVISSFAALARRCDRELYVNWTPGPGWSEEDPYDLFENRFARVSAEDFELARAEGLCLDREMAVDWTSELRPAWKDSDGASLAAVFDVRTHPVITYRGPLRCQWLVPPRTRRRLLPGFERDFVRELRTWRPVPGIRARIDEIAGSFDDHTTGVHIRRGDAARNLVVAEANAHSSDAAFIARMDRLVHSRPDASFFLATDCEATERRFRDRYGSRILTNPEKRFVPSVLGAPKDNQRDAVIDLFLLARSRLILGTHLSTFSQVAAALGGTRLQIVTEYSWLTRKRIALRL